MKQNAKTMRSTKGRRRRVLLRSLVVPAAVAIGLFGSGSAFAGYDCVAYGNGATATFKNYGEKLLIKDESSDGHSAVAKIYYGDGTKVYWNPNGAGTTRTIDFEIPEGQRVEVAACIGEYDGYRIIECSLYKVGMA
ncbi:hypothetical protein ACFW5I_09910 [Streptomyces sp. NPDC058818]|uniref:hypothetical protein n=1 Tax=Streptomyces sp. NPDC058818 TaxID=3346640 RepID=UPI00369A628D